MNKEEIADFIALEYAQVLATNVEIDRTSLALNKAKLKIEARIILEFNSVTAVSNLNLGSTLTLEAQKWEVLSGDESINSNNLNLVVLDG